MHNFYSEPVVVQVESAITEPALSEARNLFREYALMPGVTPCVAEFEREVASLPGAYSPPDGRLLVAFLNDEGSGAQAIGCAALRRLDRDACEMKRLYLRPTFRGAGAGRILVENLISEARSIGYKRMLLDTLLSMREAHKLYRKLGFVEISSYQKNPIPGALFFELTLL